MLARLLVACQYILPRHLLTALIWRVARVRHVATKNFLIRRFIDFYNVETDEIKLGVPHDFACFNDFFVRELESDARTINADDTSIVSPVDGTVSIAAHIQADALLQAKNMHYSLDDLLATDLDQARAYIDGSFATIYLAPYNYHRVHAPLDGELIAARFVPGDLFSVNAMTTSRVDQLFRRNERLVMHIATAFGPVAVILVGALNVGSISTPWTGEIRARKNGVVEELKLDNETTHVRKGELLGWFNMGSTVILLLPAGICEWNKHLTSGRTLQMGQAIGQLRGKDN